MTATTDNQNLFKELLDNAEKAESLYQKSLDAGIENTQDFINWQDRLNKVSIIPPEK